MKKTRNDFFKENFAQFELLGFKPGSEVGSMVAAVANKVYFSAPSDSILKMAVKKTRGVVKASCRIASQVGTFVAEADGRTAKRAIIRLEKKMEKQLESWKMSRFEPKSF